MKKLVSITLVACILAAALFAASAAAVTSPVEAAGAADMTLYRSGNQIVTSDGKAVRLLGVAVPQLCWNAYGDGSRTSKSDAEILVDYALSDWQCNVIRLAVLPRFWLHGSYKLDSNKNLITDKDGNPIVDVSAAEYRALVDKLVQKIKAAGKYVLLDNHSFYLPGQDSVDFWASAASVYKNDPNVIFGLFNEPAACTWDQWYNGGTVTFNGLTDWGEPANVTVTSKGMQHLIDTVRNTGAKNLVTMSGLEWGYDLTYVTTTKKLYDNTGNGLVYETHPYPERDPDWDTCIGVAAKEYPVIVGECGPKQAEGGQASDEAYVAKLTEYLDKYDLHLAAWAMGAWPHLLDWSKWPNLVPTAYGASIRNYIIKNQAEKQTTLYAGADKTGEKLSVNAGKYTAAEVTALGFNLSNIKSVSCKSAGVYEYKFVFYQNSNFTGASFEVTNTSANLTAAGLSFQPASVEIHKNVSKSEDVNIIAGMKGIAVRAQLGNFTKVTDIEAGFGSESLADNNRAKLTDGNVQTHIDIYGNMQDNAEGHDLPGVRYELDDVYELTQINVYNYATEPYAITGIRVYASENISDLYDSKNLILNTEGTQIANLKSIKLSEAKPIRYITFFLTKTQGGWRAKEFEAIVKKTSDDVETIDTNLVLGNKGTAVRALLGDFSKVLDIPAGFGSESKPVNDRAKLTDGDKSAHIDFYGNMQDNSEGHDLPGVRYDLGSVKEIHQFNAYVFAIEKYAITGLRIYASENLTDLYTKENLVLNTEGQPYAGLKSIKLATPKRARYVTFFLTSTQDGWRAKEFEVINKIPVDSQGILGDVNSDGVVSLKDATTIQKYLASMATLTDAQKKLGDVNKDGTLSLKDATTIQKYLAGLISGF